MKRESIIRAIGALDDDLIDRAGMRHTVHLKYGALNNQILRKPMRLAACIAAIMIVGVSICFATGVFDSFFNHFSESGDISKYTDYISSAITSVSDEDLEIGISGAVIDNRQGLLVFYVKALSDAGKTIVNKNDFPLLDIMNITAVLSDGTVAETNCAYGYHNGSRNRSEAWSSYVLELRPTDMDLESIETLTITYAELSMDLNIKGHMMNTIPLKSDEPDAFDLVEMSPIGIYVEMPVIDSGRDALHELSASVEIVPVMANGTPAEEYSLHGTTIYNNAKKTMHVYMNFAIIEDATLKTEITDLSIYSGLRINGINYFITEN